MKTNDKKGKLIKSYGFWMSLLSGIVLVVVQVLSLFNINIQSKAITDVISGFLGCLVVAGILTKPVEDDENDEALREIEIEEQKNTKEIQIQEEKED